MIKIICKYILQYYLKYLAKLVLAIYRPIVIAIAGSANKHFFKEQVKDRLISAGFSVRANPKDFNTEIGLPLAILDLPSGYHSYKKWWSIIWRSPLAFFKKLPQILVLELGVSNRGNMRYLLSLVNPKIAVITDITQRYLEAFDDMEELVDEYDYLVSQIDNDSLVILNHDNLKVRELTKKTKAEVCFFSLEGEASGQSGQSNFWSASIIKEEGKQQVKIWHQAKQQEYQINRPGDQHVCALLASLIIEEKTAKLSHD